MKKTYSKPVLTIVSNSVMAGSRCGHGAACNGKNRDDVIDM